MWLVQYVVLTIHTFPLDHGTLCTSVKCEDDNSNIKVVIIN